MLTSDWAHLDGGFDWCRTVFGCKQRALTLRCFDVPVLIGSKWSRGVPNRMGYEVSEASLFSI
jgi:hypothetical protein